MLAQYHPSVIAGIILLSIGGFYTCWVWPRGNKRK
jgi:hypothetical protein